MNVIKRFADMVIRWYSRGVLDHPIAVIIGLALVIGLLGYKALDFKIDASAESLVLENDEDLRYSRKVWDRYGINDILMIAFTPKEGDLLDDQNLDVIGRLRDDLAQVAGVSSVVTILDVPLFESRRESDNASSDRTVNLKSGEADFTLAANELQNSALYRDLIVSRDMKTTALVANLEIDETYQELIRERNVLLDKKAEGGLSGPEKDRFRILVKKIRQRLDLLTQKQHQNILAVRAILENYRPHGNLLLGGISMIADDMISYVKKDLQIFGIGVFLLLIFMLGLIFKKIRWIVLPMLCCFLSVTAMMGALSLFGWEVTVISSNFISLQLIITLAIAVHLIVRYREFEKNEPESTQRTLVRNTVRSKFVPCLYAALTTIAGFSSLMLCDIKPVIDFGWMMSAGLVLSLFLSFIIFPACIVFLKRPKMIKNDTKVRFSLTATLARFTQRHGTIVLVLSTLLLIFSLVGASRLVVENSFIDYFKKSSEIYQGMKKIDQKLGGTTPLDILVTFEAVDLDDFEEEDDPFADELGVDSDENSDKYWFTDERIEVLEQVHDYLESLKATGKVISVGTLLKLGRTLNKGKALDSIEITVVYDNLPQDYKDLVVKPYLSINNNEARFAVRIKDSLEGLKRNELLKQIKKELVEKVGLDKENVRLAGTMVLYNNMLQSLFASQIKTLGVVVCALLIMFWILFRDLKVALIAIFPNILSAGFVLGVMGWLNIPLDMMTITIAAISIGIAVDDTIHYIYRFRKEVAKDGDYYQTMHRCHNSIGHAMYYTSITIVIGFSILVFSNFWPNIYFGVFTGMAMFIALIASLTLLPQLLIVVKPFKVQSSEVKVQSS